VLEVDELGQARQRYSSYMPACRERSVVRRAMLLKEGDELERQAPRLRTLPFRIGRVE